MIPPRENTLLLGHAAAQHAFYAAAASGRLHHAWLIGGQPGIGKATLAYRFARWLLAGGTAEDLSVPMELPAARRVTAGTHADLLIEAVETQRSVARSYNVSQATISRLGS